jgi:hypothetical protein
MFCAVITVCWNCQNEYLIEKTVPVAELSKAWVCVRSLAWIEVRIPPRACLSLVNVVCCQVEVAASDRLSGEVLPCVQCLSYILKFNERRGHDRNEVRNATGR